MANELDQFEGDVQESKGLLATDVEYEFELTDIQVQKDVIVSKDAPEKIRGKTLDQLTPAERQDVGKNWTASYLKLSWTEIQSGVIIKESMPVGNKYNINPDKPEFESKLVRFAKRVGYQVKIGDKISPGTYLQKGMHIFARVREQIGRDKKPTGFHEIDYDTIRGGSSPKQSQQTFKVDEATKNEILKYTAGTKTKQEGTNKLVKDGRADLIEPFLQMVSAGEIKY